jgi:UDP-N-acetylmuramate dehydrogenase
MLLQENHSLKSYNTFGIDARAKYFTSFSSLEELQEALAFTSRNNSNDKKTLILGGGSNILFTQNFDGLVLKNEIKGIHTVHEDEHHIHVKAGQERTGTVL